MVQSSDGLSIRGAIVNLCNTCIGIGILAKPFALAISGWIGIIALFLAAALVTYAGVCLAFASKTLLISSNIKKSIMAHKPIINESNKAINYNSIDKDNDIEEVSAPKRSKSAYQLISNASMGKYGEIYSVIGFALIAWTIMSTCIIMNSQLLQQIVSEITSQHSINHEPSIIFIASFIIYIPAALVLNWRQMTFISSIGVISVIAMLLIL